MNKFKNRQLLLKGALLVALGANLSWNPEQMSLDLASSSGEVLAGESAPAEETETAAAEAPNTNEKSATQPQEKQEKKDKTVRQMTKKVCGKRFLITFRELKIDNELKTEMDIAAHSEEENFKPVKYRVRGGFKLNLENERVRQDVEAEIDRLVKSRYGGSCPGEKKTTVVAKPAVEKKKTVSKKSKRKNKKTELGECRRDKDGERLTDLERAECLIEKLADLESDYDNRSRTKVMTRLEKTIKGEIRSILKKKLKSADEVDLEEGEELLEQVIGQINDLADDHDLDKRRTDRLVKELEALRAGSETYRRSSVLAEEVNSMRADLQARMQQAQAELRANPNDLWLRQQVLNLQGELLVQQNVINQQLQSEIINGPYRSLVYAQQMGLINSTEFKEFTNPISMLRQQLFSSINVNGSALPGVSTLGPNTFTPPTDFMQYRMNLNQRGATVTTPANTTTAASTILGANRFSTSPLATPPAPMNPMLGNYGLSTLTNPLTGTFNCLSCTPSTLSTIPGVQRL